MAFIYLTFGFCNFLVSVLKILLVHFRLLPQNEMSHCTDCKAYAQTKSEALRTQPHLKLLYQTSTYVDFCIQSNEFHPHAIFTLHCLKKKKKKSLKTKGSSLLSNIKLFFLQIRLLKVLYLSGDLQGFWCKIQPKSQQCRDGKALSNQISRPPRHYIILSSKRVLGKLASESKFTQRHICTI